MYDKDLLQEVIFKINSKYPFLINSTFWSSPTSGFSYDKSIITKSMDTIMKSNIIKEDRNSVICILCDWENVAEGIYFTDMAMYVNSPKNESKKFSARYKDIEELKYFSSSPELRITTNHGNTYYITSPIWNKRNIKIFLEIASGKMNFDDEDNKRIKDIKLEINNKQAVGLQAAGIVYGNVSNASTLYGMDKFNTPRGHGFAAERANHLYDKFSGKNAQIIGDDNAKFGADRIVEGINIQSKYCNSGSRCIQECFHKGSFKYINPDGSPMQIEVPLDKYEDAIKAMENRIEGGQVPGVSNPEEAKNIVRKGHFTYAQAKNVAKAGTVESIVFDAANGVIISTTAFGITAALTFATNIWNGEDLDTSLKTATYSGLRVGGTTFITAIFAGQFSKAGLNSALVGSTETLVRVMGPKASATLVNAFRSGTNIYGAAAMKSAAKMLRGNAITGVASVVVLSSIDVVNIFRGRISGAQLFKNITNTASTVAGGTAGWWGGASIGATVGSVIPVVGTAVGATIGALSGALVGGSVAGKATNTIINKFIEDDAEEMVNILEKVFLELTEDYLLNEKEAKNIVDNLKGDLTGGELKNMFASQDRILYAQKLLERHIEGEVKKRDKINMPTVEEMQDTLKIVLEDISDNLAYS